MLGITLYRDEAVHEVPKRLNICAKGLASLDLPARSGISQTRARLRTDPVDDLFRNCGQHWGAEHYPDDDWQGMQVLPIDGALLRTADTPELRAHFGSGNTDTERQTPYPLMRLVALMNARSHIMLDSRLSPYRLGEARLAEGLLDRFPDRSVRLLNKGFWGADLLLSLDGNGAERHCLTPSRSNLVAKEVKRYNAHDRLLKMRISPQA